MPVRAMGRKAVKRRIVSVGFEKSLFYVDNEFGEVNKERCQAIIEILPTSEPVLPDYKKYKLFDSLN
jgi:uncharacterized protein YfbU (UPF0304 family)